MKNFDLYSMGVQEMNTREMKETDGGFIWFLVAAVVVLCTASSCVNGDLTFQFGHTNISNPNGGGKIEADTSFNGNKLNPMMDPGVSILP
jgi:hypothetical protein